MGKHVIPAKAGILYLMVQSLIKRLLDACIRGYDVHDRNGYFAQIHCAT
jgi:hypothetical protein